MIRRLKPRSAHTRIAGVALVTALAALATAALVTASAGQAAPSRSLQAPTNTAPPAISGAPVVGQTLSTTTGSWDSSSPITFYSFHWARCDTAGDGCQNVANGTNQTYTLVSADAGHAMRVYVTANNADGYTTQRSAPTGVVGGVPQNTSLPTISGNPIIGQTLTASTGSWTPSSGVTFTFLWGRCNSSGGGCGNIGGAHSQTYVPTSSDAGHTLIVYVTGNNGAGATTVHSNPTGIVVSSASLPKNTNAPTISGTTQVGQTLTAHVGQWSSSLPITSYTYLWARCDSNGNNCGNIDSARKSTYTLTQADQGHRLLVYVTANTQSGYTTAHSAKTGVVGAGSTPKSTSPPVIGGTAQVGQTLTASVGGWSSSLPITSYSYQWGRCDQNGQNCTNIGGATKNTYTVESADNGHRLLVYVSANTAAGYTTAHSAPTAVVGGSGLPAGAIRLGNGKVSVPASTVRLPARLVIDNVKFQPKRIQGRSPFVARFHVSDTRGYAVRGVRVYALGLPYSWVQKGVEVSTDTNGWATMTITPSKKLPIGRGHAIVMFVRALVPGQPILAGSSARRLVQITTAGKR